MTEKPANPSYMQTNIELAQENGQLKQQLGQYKNEYVLQSEKIVELKSQVFELASIKEKYDHIVRIVLDMGSSEASSLSSLAGADSSISSVISEVNRVRQQSEQGPNVTSEHINRTVNLGRITENSVEDSLQPPDVTSVSPLRPDKPHVQTPSLWRVLDDTPGTIQNRHEHEGRQGSTFDKGPLQDPENDRNESQDSTTQHNPLPQNGTTNSASPIHPVGAHRILAQNSVFHSTPVFIPRSQQQKDLENQENLAHENHHISTIQQSDGRDSSIEQTQPQGQHPVSPEKELPPSPPKSQPKTKPKARKRQAKQTEAKKICRETPEPEEAPRYNLRKRSKQQV